MTLKPMKCECCGGIIDKASMTCQMCGIAYEFDDQMQPIKIVEYSTKVETLKGTVLMPAEFMISNPKECSHYALEKMAHEMASHLLPFIEYSVEFSPELREYTINGRLRVANPHETRMRGNYHEIVQ